MKIPGIFRKFLDWLLEKKKEVIELLNFYNLHTEHSNFKITIKIWMKDFKLNVAIHWDEWGVNAFWYISIFFIAIFFEFCVFKFFFGEPFTSLFFSGLYRFFYFCYHFLPMIFIVIYEYFSDLESPDKLRAFSRTVIWIYLINIFLLFFFSFSYITGFYFFI